MQQIRDRVDLGKGREMTAGQLCEQFGFTKEKQWTPVGDLSGGERRRLQLLRLLMAEPNVLFLDEPTNDLDIETLTQLEDLLDGWPGSLVVISTTASSSSAPRTARTRCSATAPCGCCPAASTSTWSAASGCCSRPPAAPRALRHPDPPRRRRAKAEKAARVVSAAEARAAKKELQRIERKLDKLSEQEAALHADIAADPTDFAKVAELDARLRELGAERDELELRWLELAEDA